MNRRTLLSHMKPAAVALLIAAAYAGLLDLERRITGEPHETQTETGAQHP